MKRDTFINLQPLVRYNQDSVATQVIRDVVVEQIRLGIILIKICPNFLGKNHK